MSVGGWIATIVGGGVFSLVAFAIVQHNIRILRTRKALRELSDEDYFGCLRCVDAFSDEKQTTVLFIDPGRELPSEIPKSAWIRKEQTPLTDASAEARLLIQLFIPPDLQLAPWNGATLQLYETRDEFTCLQPMETQSEPVLAEIAVPDQQRAFLFPMHLPRLKHGKQFRNCFAPSKLLQRVPGLRERLNKSEATSESLLAYMMAPTIYGFDADVFDRIQVGGSQAWVQDPEVPKCDACRERMLFIAQIGLNASDSFPKNRRDGVVYVFGCKNHAAKFRCIYQCT
jgi:hypothetical protein